ncbi:uncharacterized protein A1O9_02824 [Exophiala aquamarina CBS 119918]|uniref:Uncharacterized protein n=1 Tax=Exophiala aquamarina CBS 119918 TaxID=1182545 RepID=A0A072PMI3_9EURO|nr:uncharacterized protein A1O9_02824 [Exophiala aquamarina CBS 119918]KEF61259.1 hypothetical protein A1O9_02824 [Exophiala aquamarina CBS 119918]
MPSPAKKRQISDFFQPYVKSSVPAKRPSPSSEQASQRKSPVRDVSPTRTPKAVRHHQLDGKVRTPTAPPFSPLSTPNSRSSLPIRSPRPKSGLQPPTTYQRAPRFGSQTKKDAAPKPSTHSFNFADLPGSTQVAARGREIIEIRDSDEDTDSLVSLDDILGRRKDEHTTSCSSSPDVDEDQIEKERVKTLSLFTHGRSEPLVGKDKLRALYAQQHAQKFDIRGILGDHFDDQETEEKVKKAQDNYKESTKPQLQNRSWEVDRKLLATVATTEDGDEGVSRLLNAVQRQEVLSSNLTFSFFRPVGDDDRACTSTAQDPFPEASIPHRLWRPKDDRARSRAYLSGHMVELATRRQLGSDVFKWTFHNVVHESHDGVRQAYINCLSEASAAWTRTNITAADVQRVFQNLGAESASLQDSGLIKPRPRSTKDTCGRNPKHLLAALQLFQLICQDMDFAALSKLTSTLCRLAIDQQLMSDGLVSVKVEELLQTMLSFTDFDTQSHVVERMIDDVGRRLETPLLQARLLAHVLPVSPTACRTRVLLAQAFLFGADKFHSNKPAPFEINLDSLTQLITTSPSFNTTRHKSSDPLDYASLRSLAHILDVAIGDGGRPPSFPSRGEEIVFNRSVDRLADAVRATFISIVDTGASHMSRTEAKDVLQALHWRLLYSVRTEVRPKKSIFDAKTGKTRDGEAMRGEDRARDFLKHFLDRQKGKEQGTKQQQQMPLADQQEQEQAPSGPRIDMMAETDTLILEAENTEPEAPANSASVVSNATTSTASSETISEPSETETAIRAQLGLS